MIALHIVVRDLYTTIYTYVQYNLKYFKAISNVAHFPLECATLLFKGHSVQPANYTLSEATNNSHFSQLIEINCSSG